MLNDGIVHLWDLPKTSVCVKLPNEMQKSMADTALRIARNSYKKLADILNINYITVYDFKDSRFKSITLDFILKLSGFLERNGFNEFSLENIETKIELIKTKWIGKAIYHPKFPMNFINENGARIIAAILFDGGVTSNCRPFYTNNEECLIDQILNDIKSITGNIEFYKRKDNNTFDIEFPKIFGLILINGLGIIPGAKVFNNPTIPRFILKNHKLHKSFLNHAFDDEGNVNTNFGGRSISLTQYHTKREPPIRLLQLKGLIEKFHIPANGPHGPHKEYNAKKGYTSYCWSIEISNQPDIRRFAEEINFSLERKRMKLQQLLDSYKLPPRFKKGIIQNEVIRACEELKKENKKISIKNIANKLNRNESWVSEVLGNMVKEEKLKIIKDKTPLKGDIRGFEEKEFEVMK